MIEYFSVWTSCENNLIRITSPCKRLWLNATEPWTPYSCFDINVKKLNLRRQQKLTRDKFEDILKLKPKLVQSQVKAKGNSITVKVMPAASSLRKNMGHEQNLTQTSRHFKKCLKAVIRLFLFFPKLRQKIKELSKSKIQPSWTFGLF